MGNDPFAVFANKTLHVFKQSGSTIGPEGGTIPSWTKLGQLRGDYQPYSGGLALKQYGYNGDCSVRFLLTDDDGLLVEGRYADEDSDSLNPRFLITYVPEGLSFKVALLKERE